MHNFSTLCVVCVTHLVDAAPRYQMLQTVRAGKIVRVYTLVPGKRQKSFFLLLHFHNFLLSSLASPGFGTSHNTCRSWTSALHSTVRTPGNAPSKQICEPKHNAHLLQDRIAMQLSPGYPAVRTGRRLHQDQDPSC